MKMLLSKVLHVMHLSPFRPSILKIFSLLVVFLIGCHPNRSSRDYLDAALKQSVSPLFEKTSVGPQQDDSYVVATSQRIDPAGENIIFPGRPVDLALSPDEKLLVIKNINNLVFLNTATNQIVQTLKLPKGGNTFGGIAWSDRGSMVWTTDTRGRLRAAEKQSDGSFAWSVEILLPSMSADDKNGAYPGGLTIDEANERILVTLNRNNTLAIVNLKSHLVEKQIPVGIAPYGVILTNNKAYVSNWGGRRPTGGDKTGPTAESRAIVDPETGIASSGTVSVVDLPSYQVTTEIETGLHPSGMALSPDKNTLYVANANSDFISIIDTKLNKVTGQISTKPMESLPLGSAPNALDISPDGQTLYVANGGNNLIAVIDLIDKKITGLIPTGWYPGAVNLSSQGNRLYVANVKGIGGDYRGSANTRAKAWEYAGQAKHPVPPKGLNSREYLGSVSVIDVPDQNKLAEYTLKAASNMRLPKIIASMNLPEVEEKIVPVPVNPGEKSVFKHVLYIIKENRTYDQIFGDMEQGNGDPDLCFYGSKVTPNHHALAETFVLLDNTYCNGVLSADGHQWTDEGNVTDYLEKSFGGFERSYPYDGNDALAYSASGFIWDYVLNANLTFRNYGEFVGAKIDPPTATWEDNYLDFTQQKGAIKIQSIPQLHTLAPYTCPTYIGFPGTVQDIYRAGEFIKELKKYEANGNLPNFMMMLLPNDHTVATREGFPTPRAAVADNDLALGQIIEAVSHSTFWKETAIFVVEDDPQAGLDHVDGRRTVAFCISPYTKRGEVIHTHYNQNSILRTIELILGLPPMNQFDMTANVMTNCFTETPDYSPYIALKNNIPLDEMNPRIASLNKHEKQYYYAQKSMKMDLDEIDKADENLFNRILWHDAKGYDVAYPSLAKTNAESKDTDL